jgi:hypothetical protein
MAEMMARAKQKVADDAAATEKPKRPLTIAELSERARQDVAAQEADQTAGQVDPSVTP